MKFNRRLEKTILKNAPLAFLSGVKKPARIRPRVVAANFPRERSTSRKKFHRDDGSTCFGSTCFRTRINLFSNKMLRLLVVSALLASACSGYKIAGTPDPATKGQQRCVTIQECPYLVQMVENGAQVEIRGSML
jgi:hypothetical protein